MTFSLKNIILLSRGDTMDKNIENITLSIDTDVLKKFKYALDFNSENMQNTLENFMEEYFKKTFLTNTIERNVQATAPVATHQQVKTDDIPKAIKRIHLWAKRPKQVNHQIIKAYLQLAKDNATIKLDDLEYACKHLVDNNEQNIFMKNYNSMKTDAGNSHGKVFEEYAGVVTIWEPIKETLEQYKQYFLV